MAEINRRRFLASAMVLGAAAVTGCTSGNGATPVATTLGGAAPGGAAQASALADLRSRLKGRLLLPTDDGYRDASASKNSRFSVTRPLAVAQVADTDDVVTCVKWCRDNGVQPVARGGGHSYAGFSTTTGLVIALGALNSVDIDRSSGRAVVGGSARNQDVFSAEVDGPFIIPAGTCLQVCVGGLTLGGGIGYNSHWAGLTCDTLVSTKIVTADGELVNASATENSDLFWACRGGSGGSFGINTELTFQAVPVPQETISYFELAWRGVDAAGAVLHAFDQLMQHAPDALSAVAWAQAAPVGAGGANEAIDVGSRGLFIGSSADLRDLVQPLIDAGGRPTASTVIDKRFWDLQRDRVTQEGAAHSWGDISRYAKGPVPPEAFAKQAQLLATCPQRSADANGAMWELGWVGGGVVGKYGRTDTAYVHRDATNLLRPTVVWPADADPGVAADLEAWTDDMIAAIAPYTPAESYQNFPNRLISDWGHQYYAENWDRLVDIKTRVDPTNLFNNAQSIPPNPARS